MLAIISGSGSVDLGKPRREVVRTPFGLPSAPLGFVEIDGKTVVTLARHGHGHAIPPHRINYRANLWALHSMGVTDILSVATVGGISDAMPPGRLSVPDQLIDYTWGREHTFASFDNNEPVQHLDYTKPYCDAMRERILTALKSCGCDNVFPTGVYGVSQGPRLETAAEVDRMTRDGCDMVGMTAMPEAYLARELGLCYGALAISVNWAAGRGDSADAVSFAIAGGMMQTLMADVREMVLKML
jgi:5'-methylthioadenosine phosphorylase